MTPLERYLLDNGGWVRVAEICRLFQIHDERTLRSRDGEPGICSDFAISGNLGLKHVDHATAAEWDRFYGRVRSHSVGQLVRLKRLRDRRAARQLPLKQISLELDPTPQPLTHP